MKKSITKITVLLLMIILLSLMFIGKESSAVSRVLQLEEKWFYIKNAHTGRYLDVSGGTAVPGTNIQQYEFNGSAAQMWCLLHQGNGEYVIGSMLRFNCSW